MDRKFLQNYLNNYMQRIKQLLSSEEKRAGEQIRTIETIKNNAESGKRNKLDAAFTIFMITKINSIINFFHKPKKVKANIDGE